jgi:hypothetical protein
MNIKRTIARTIILGAALGTGVLAQDLVRDALVPGSVTVLAPSSADSRSISTPPGPVPSPPPDPVQAMSAGPGEFEDQAYTEDDSPRIIGMDPGIYLLPAWSAYADTSVRLV